MFLSPIHHHTRRTELERNQQPKQLFHSMAQATFFLVMFYIPLLGIGKGVSGASPPAAAAAVAPPRPRDCPDKCGDVTVPYPFGIGPGCSLRRSFGLNCSEGVQLKGSIQIESITLETAQMVAYLRSTYTCSAQGMGSPSEDMSFNLGGGQFLLSPADNVFTAIGCSLQARLNGRIGSSADRYLTGCITTCTSVDLDDIGQEGAPCSGRGCCQASIAPGLRYVASRWSKNKQNNNPAVPNNTCQYAFVAKKGWYVPDQMIYPLRPELIVVEMDKNDCI